MWEFCEEIKPIAKKDYCCDASDYISEMDDCDFCSDDIEVIEKARVEGNKILKGTKYIKISGKWDGEFAVFRARPDLDEICRKNNLYREP